MKNDFEEYLKDKHAENYHGTDDGMPDDFERWLSDMDTELMLAYGDAFGAAKALQASKELGEALLNLKTK